MTLTAFGASAHAANVPVIISEARAQDEVMNYAVNLTADAFLSVSGRPGSPPRAVCRAGEGMGYGRAVGDVKQVQMLIWHMVTVWVFMFWHVVIA